MLPLLFVAGCLAFSCSGGGEAERVRQRIDQGAELAERRDLNGLLALTTSGFRADPGDRDREATAEAVAAAFYYYRKFRVLYPEPSVKLDTDGRSATAGLYFLIVKEDRSYPDLRDLAADPQGWLAKVGENADLYFLELLFQKPTDQWLVHRSRLTRFGQAGFPR